MTTKARSYRVKSRHFKIFSIIIINRIYNIVTNYLIWLWFPVTYLDWFSLITSIHILYYIIFISTYKYIIDFFRMLLNVIWYFPQKKKIILGCLTSINYLSKPFRSGKNLSGTSLQNIYFQILTEFHRQKKNFDSVRWLHFVDILL